MDLVTDLFASSWAPGLITTFARTYQQHVAVAILGAGFLFYAIANRTKFFAIPRGRRPLDTPHDTARLAELIAHHGLIAKPEIPDRHIQTVFACAGCGFTGRSRISHGRHIAELHVLGQAAGPTCRRAAGQARMSQPHADEMLLAIWLDGFVSGCITTVNRFHPPAEPGHVEQCAMQFANWCADSAENYPAVMETVVAQIRSILSGNPDPVIRFLKVYSAKGNDHD